jgi:hypothetical protein
MQTQGILCPGEKRPRRQSDHSTLSSAVIKNEWSYTSIPPICLHCVHWDNFTFTFYPQVV